MTAIDGRMFVNGQRTWANSGSTFDAIDPANGQAFTAVARGDETDVDAAVRAAHIAVDAGWTGLAPVRRVRILNRLAALLRDQRQEFAQLESLDVGKPLRQAEDDVEAAAAYFEFFAGVADKVFGSSIPLGKGFVDFTLREPLGVCAQIVPWNYPLRLASRGIAPALACGNAVVAKPAAEAGLSIVRLAELAADAGIPAGVFNVVTGGRETGAALVAHPGINHVTFTGSVPTGIAIMKAAADHVVPVTLELGGKSPNIVFADKVFGSSIPLGKGFVDFTLREPLGVCAQIVPWNYPLRLASRGIAPALACGNAVVAKPAAEAGLSIVRRPFSEAGPRPGVLHRTDVARPGAARIGARAGRDLWSGADRDQLRLGRRGDRDRERHALRPGHRHLDERPRQGLDGRDRGQGGSDTGECVQRRGKHWPALRWLQAQRFRPRAGG